MDMSAIQNFEPRKFAPMPAQQPHQMQMTSSFKAAPLQIQAPRVLEFSPQIGAEGHSFTVTLQCSPDKILRIGFGTLVVDTKQYAANGYVTLSCSIPNFAITKWYSNKVPLYVLQMENDMVLESWPFGDFTYFEDNNNNNNNNSNNNSKRSSIDNKMLLQQTSPLTSPTPGPIGGLSRNDYNNTLAATSYDSASLYQSQQPTSSYAARPMTPASYNRSGFYNTNQMMAPHMPTYSQADLAASSTYAMATTTTSNHNTGYIQSHPSQAMSSYMPQSHPAANTINSSLPLGSYNPYATMINKANLKFAGNMEDMSINWSGDEWESHRRLVQFWRRQDGTDIQCSFAPVAPSERQPNSIVVSCIYWAERNDCFLTSVDCIYLLESLIAVRFTVEEKNRIRRNLEGFRPITVSKCKPDSAEFFKLIMSFPNPKPRNIEKDVKVFPWKVLPYALKKIISKYTASYSSTASIQTDAFHNANFPHGSTLPLTPQQQTILESSLIS